MFNPAISTLIYGPAGSTSCSLTPPVSKVSSIAWVVVLIETLTSDTATPCPGSK